MTIGTDIYSVLSNDATVTSLASTRIYPNWTPQDVTYPCIVYFSNGDEVANDLAGESALAHHNYEIEVFAETYSAAQSLADAVKDAMLATSTFKAIRLNQSDAYNPTVDIHSIGVEFSLWQ